MSAALDPNSSVCVRRKPAPPTAAHIHIPDPQQQQPTQSFHKLSFSERYPDPDPTDPFAPLWVLRNRTSSALHRLADAPPVLGHLVQQEEIDEFGAIRQPDRRRSISYLHTLAAASTFNVHDTVAQPAYASDHGHGGTASVMRTYSISNGGNTSGNIASTVRRQSLKPTRLSQVTALAIPSLSRGSVSVSPVVPKSPVPITRVVQQPQPPRVDNDSSGTETDSTRVGHSGAEELDTTIRATTQHHVYEPQQQQRPRTGSTNKLARFLKPRRASQSDSNSHNVRASIADIDRIRKASISPPVFSTVVWAGQGQDFLPIADHPLQRSAISLVPVGPDPTDAPPPASQVQAPITGHAKQGSIPVETPTPIRPTSSHLPLTQPLPPSEIVQVPTLPHDDTPLSPSIPPVLVSRQSQTSHGHTDESHSTFSFVHVPSTFSSPSFAHLVPDVVPPRRAPALASRPSTSPLPMSSIAAGPGASATIASLATMKIKRSASRSTSRLPPLTHSAFPLSPLNSASTAMPLSPVLSDSEPVVGEWDLPTFRELSEAASLPIIAESGVRINFGALFVQQRVVVVFIRHFWCPLCQDYMTSVASLTRRIPELLLGPQDKELSNEKIDVAGEDSGIKGEVRGPVKLVVIGNGSYTMIGKYKQIFGTGAVALDVYTDPSLAVYAALGMGKDPASLPDHPHPHDHRHGPGHKRSKGGGSQARLDAEMLGGGGKNKGYTSGGYVKHGLMGGIAMVFVRALKVGMPVWEKGGDLNQLGGEFVFGPGLICTYAHRMQTTKDHAPFEDVLRAAGVVIPLRPLQIKEREREQRKERETVKKVSPLRKPRPSIGGNDTANPKTRARGQTIDIVPILAPIPSAPSPIHTSASIPVAASLSSKPSQGRISTNPEKRKSSHRRRRSVVRPSNVSINAKVAPISGSLVQQKMKPTTLEGEEREREGEKNAPVRVPDSPTTTGVSSIIVSKMSGAPTSQPGNQSTIPTGESLSPTHVDDPRRIENRHRSLQKIKERKHARRGLSSVDERQVTNVSMSISNSHSRSLLPSDPHSHLLPISQSTTPQDCHLKGMERTKSRPRHGSGSIFTGGANVGRSKATDTERGVQSDTGLMKMQREMSAKETRNKGGGDDDIVLLGREIRMNKINLSRDYLVRREGVTEEAESTMGVGVQAEDDAETVSDKTMVHQ